MGRVDGIERLGRDFARITRPRARTTLFTRAVTTRRVRSTIRRGRWRPSGMVRVRVRVRRSRRRRRRLLLAGLLLSSSWSAWRWPCWPAPALGQARGRGGAARPDGREGRALDHDRIGQARGYVEQARSARRPGAEPRRRARRRRVVGRSPSPAVRSTTSDTSSTRSTRRTSVAELGVQIYPIVSGASARSSSRGQRIDLAMLAGRRRPHVGDRPTPRPGDRRPRPGQRQHTRRRRLDHAPRRPRLSPT